VPERLSFNALHTGALWLLDGGAYLATRTQSGQLRRYLTVMLISLVALMLLFGRMPLPAAIPPLVLDELAILRVFTLVLAAAAAALSITLRRDFNAILALGASGLSVAVIMVLEPAPDVALVQVVVDILSVVILVLALGSLPREQRRRAWELTFKQSRRGLARDVLIAAAGGFAVAVLAFTGLTSRPRESLVTPFYETNAKPLTGAADIVGAVVVDFRGFDTLIEIAVFGLAGIGVYTLLRYAARGVESGRQGNKETGKQGDMVLAASSQLVKFGAGGAWQQPSGRRRLVRGGRYEHTCQRAQRRRISRSSPGTGDTDTTLTRCPS
jgi:multisubunit Na+/H+ antiporter MnhB subunit